MVQWLQRDQFWDDKYVSWTVMTVIKLCIICIPHQPIGTFWVFIPSDSQLPVPEMRRSISLIVESLWRLPLVSIRFSSMTSSSLKLGLASTIIPLMCIISLQSMVGIDSGWALLFSNPRYYPLVQAYRSVRQHFDYSLPATTPCLVPHSKCKLLYTISRETMLLEDRQF